MGGFGSQAFLGCEHTEEGQQPAVFVFLPDEIVDKPEVFEQLLQETEVAAQIDHINVMSVFGLARIDDGFARIVEYGNAESLLSVFQRAKDTGVAIPTSVAITIATDGTIYTSYGGNLNAIAGSPRGAAPTSSPQHGGNEQHSGRVISAPDVSISAPTDLSHFGSEANLFEELEAMFAEYGRSGTGQRRYYLHTPEEAEPYNQESGTFTEQEAILQMIDAVVRERMGCRK